MPAIVVGLHPDRVVENWVHEGKLLTKDDARSVVIGDALLGIFSAYSIENISLWGRCFPIVGVVADPLNMGRTVYLPYQTLKEIVGAGGPNILLLGGEGSSEIFIESVEEEATKYGLIVVPLDRAVENNILWELQAVTGNYKLRLKDIMEWSTSEEHVKKNLRESEGEKMIKVGGIGVWVAYKEPVKKPGERS